ncbi:tail fiber domain-containing protein [Limosilactobacillus fermentum]|uniref:tail fiber domain-containing protein n=1 Tax=Limosilactobacillus fermentum TaxID=1613 RepID=UPI0034624A13
MPMDNVTLENTQQSISSRDAKSVASVMVNGKWVNLSDTLEQANVKSDVGTVAKQVAAQQEVVSNAASTADSAVAYANDAVEKSRVNSQAIVDINSAVSDAVSGAAVARSDGLRAWNAAQSNVGLIDSNYASASAAISSARTEAIAAADEAKASASAAQAGIVTVRSDVAAVQADVTATRSDVAVAKSAIADTKTSLTSQAKSLSSYAAQASANGADIVTLKSQAGQLEQDMASTKGDVSQLKVSASSASVALSDATGNISSLQATAKSYSAALSDTNSNVASVTATASELETKYADAAGDISQIKTDAKGMTQTISDAQGDIAKLKTRADGFDTQFADTNGNINKLQTDATGTKQTLTNAKSDIAVLQSRADGFDTKYADAAGDINTLKADASGFSQTLTDAKGDISTLQSTATGFKNTLTDAQGNISTLQSDVSGLKKTTSDNAGNIATLQADAETLTSQMRSAQGDISTLKQTASDFSSKVSGMETSLADANGKINGITSNGGGRNLAIGTDQEYAMGYGIPTTTWEDGYAYLKLPITLTASGIEILPQDPHTFYYNLTPGQEYTQTVWLETDATVKDLSVAQITWWTTAGHDWQSATLINLGENRYKLYSTYKWPGKSDNNVRLFDICALNSAFDLSTGTYLKFGKLMLEEGIISHDWSPAPEDTDAKITANTTAIEQNKNAIALKANQTTVDKTNGTVQQLQTQLKVQADQIASKVSSSDLDAKGYATQAYTQTQIQQTANSWNANLTSVSNGLTQSYTNLHATVDGIQAQVYNSDGSSKITQLSNLIATKVSQGDYNSQITQLKNDINLRVAKGDVISQINQEAGGNTLIQVSNGKKSLILDAGNTIITGKAWIPSAAIADLTADQVQAGTLSGSKVHAGDNSGNAIDMGALSTNYVGFHAYANNGDNTFIDLNGIHNYGASYDTRIQQGKITTNYLAVNGGGMIDFRNSDGTGMVADGSTLTFDVSNTPAGYLSYNGMPVAEIPDGSGGNELAIRYGLSAAIIPEDSNGAQATFSKSAQKIAYMTGTDQGKQMLSGLEVHSNNHHWLGAVNSDATCNRFEVNDRDGLNITWHDNTHFWISDGNAKLYKDTDDGQTATKLEIHGWAWINGWCEAAGHSQHSALSTKTDIQSVDDDKMLKMVNDTDLTTFLYKTDVANGETHRHIGPIIDDVHDVAQYQTPQDFIAPNGVSRDDDNMIGALFGAVKALTKRIKTLESKVG